MTPPGLRKEEIYSGLETRGRGPTDPVLEGWTTMVVRGIVGTEGSD